MSDAAAMRRRLDEARDELIAGMRERKLGNWIQRSEILDDVARVIAAEEVVALAELAERQSAAKAAAAELIDRWATLAAELAQAPDDVRREVAGRIAVDVEGDARWSPERGADLTRRMTTMWFEVDRLAPVARLEFVAAAYAAAHERLTTTTRSKKP